MMISVNIYSHYKGQVRLNSSGNIYWVVIEQPGGAELTIFVSDEDLQIRLATILRECFEQPVIIAPSTEKELPF